MHNLIFNNHYFLSPNLNLNTSDTGSLNAWCLAFSCSESLPFLSFPLTFKNYSSSPSRAALENPTSSDPLNCHRLKAVINSSLDSFYPTKSFQILQPTSYYMVLVSSGILNVFLLNQINFYFPDSVD